MERSEKRDFKEKLTINRLVAVSMRGEDRAKPKDPRTVMQELSDRVLLRV